MDTVQEIDCIFRFLICQVQEKSEIQAIPKLKEST